MAKTAKKTKSKIREPRKTRPLRSKNVPVTKGMLDAFDSKIARRMTSVELLFKSHSQRFDSIDKRFESIDARFDAIDKRFESIDRRFEAVDARFDALESKMDSKFEMVMSAIHQQTALIEEQNARNKIVLDGYEQLYRRMRELEGN